MPPPWPENRFISACPATTPPATPAAVCSAPPRKPVPRGCICGGYCGAYWGVYCGGGAYCCWGGGAAGPLPNRLPKKPRDCCGGCPCGCAPLPQGEPG